MKTCVCANCGTTFERYNMNAMRAARPQFCRRKCQTEYSARLSDGRRETRFWSKVDQTGECWVWKGFKDNNGYGRFQYSDGKPVLAHRYALSLAIGRMPSLHVCHHCDNPWCVRPSHLFEGTQKDNMADCAKKGRTNRVPHRRGEAVNTAKITAEQAADIYCSQEPNPVLAHRYGLTKEAVSMIKRGRNWAWATGAKREGV